MSGKKVWLLLSAFLLVADLPMASVKFFSNNKKFEKHVIELRSPASWDTAKIIREYPFINLNRNEILYAGDTNALNSFYEKLYDLVVTKTGKVNVMHIGGSHVQAGTLTGKMRENIQQMTSGIHGQYGFFFPFKMANTNGPSEIKVNHYGAWKSCRAVRNSDSCSWGLAGIQTATSDSAAGFSIKVMRKDSSVYNFNSALVYHNPSNAYRLEVVNPEFADLGYSNAKGFTRINFKKQADSLELRVIKQDDSTSEKFELQGIQFLNDIAGVTYTAVGNNGASVPTYLRCDKFVQHLETAVPDLVIFGIGINDANLPANEFGKNEYKANYRKLMERIQSVNPDVRFLFLTNNDSYFKRKIPNRNALKVREAMMELSAEYNAAVWDFFGVMGELNAIRKWELAGLAKPDKVHLTNSGYHLMADLMFDALKRDFEKFIEKKNTEKE